MTIVPNAWVELLRLVPFALGGKGLVAIRLRGDDEPPAVPVAAGPLPVTGVTIANGADNFSVYTPMFRTIWLVDSPITVAVFSPSGRRDVDLQAP